MIYDVIVVGAGPSGSLAADNLAKHGLQVLLVDKSEFPRDKTCGDALSPRAVKIFKDVGVLPKIRQHAFISSKVDFYSPSGKEVSIDLPQRKDFEEIFLLERFVLDQLLYEMAVSSGAEFVGNVDVRDIHFESDHAAVEGSSNGKKEIFRSRVVVLAAGANIALLKKTGLFYADEYLTLASRVYYEGDFDFSNLKFVYADMPLPGYAWLFPVGPNKINVGAGFSKAGGKFDFKSSKQLLEYFLSTKLAKRSLRKMEAIGKIKSYPLFMGYPNTQVYQDRLLVVGEAAGLVNPLTGEGVDYSMMSGILASNVLTEAFDSGDFSKQQFEKYKNLLDKEYYNQFIMSSRLRKLFFSNQFVLGSFFSLLQRSKKFQETFLRIVLGFPS